MIVGSLGFIGGCAYVYESQYGRISAEDAFEIALDGLLGFAVSTVAVTFFSSLVRWVREGFGGNS